MPEALAPGQCQIIASVQFTKKAANSCVTQPFLANLYPSCYDPSNTSSVQKLISFDTNSTEAAGTTTALKNDIDWLDFSTEELVVTIVTYNGELQGTLSRSVSNPYSVSIPVATDIVVLVVFLLDRVGFGFTGTSAGSTPAPSASTMPLVSPKPVAVAVVSMATSAELPAVWQSVFVLPDFMCKTLPDFMCNSTCKAMRTLHRM
ncbi:hypothetical protein PR003_g13002 [Phytophthora rubi]|uniref:Uncharacterized protein n=1 Tax=Phytophthora rubi TaxID=129364 RepID=A0A6A4F6Y9_9STRA|nr:hypothetical protein PR003_g13002 [Phytophthora rubi]